MATKNHPLRLHRGDESPPNKSGPGGDYVHTRLPSWMSWRISMLALIVVVAVYFVTTTFPQVAVGLAAGMISMLFIVGEPR